MGLTDYFNDSSLNCERSYILPSELVSFPLSFNKNQDLGVTITANLLQQSGQFLFLLPLFANINNLEKRTVSGRESRRNGMLNISAQGSFQYKTDLVHVIRS